VTRKSDQFSKRSIRQINILENKSDFTRLSFTASPIQNEKLPMLVFDFRGSHPQHEDFLITIIES